MTRILETKIASNGTTATIQQEKFSACYRLIVTDRSGSLIKNDIYMSINNAKKAGNRLFKQCVTDSACKWEKA